MKGSISDDEILDLYLLLGRTRDAVRMVRTAELAQIGMTPEQAAIIHLIHDIGGEAKPTEISLWLFRKRNSIHAIIERMVKSGLLKKVDDPIRKNGVKIILSEKSKKLHHRIANRDSLRKIIASLSVKERNGLRSSLETLFSKAREMANVNDNLPLRPKTRRK